MRAETSQQEADRLLAEDRASRVRVDHRAPIHDRLCRCRDCKPSFARRGPTMPKHLAVGVAIWAVIVIVLRAVL